MKLDTSKFDSTWDRRRGRAARLMALLIRDDDEALYSRVSTDPATAKAYGEASTYFEREASLLRKTAKLFETAAARLTSVLTRYRLQPAM